MNIDRSEFIAWMQRIIERLNVIDDYIKEQKNSRVSIDGEELLDNQDLLFMLKVSGRSLQRYRASGRLPFYTISGKIYYKTSDVHQFIRESFSRIPPSKTMSDK
ncbi:helix-turn-helix domain-containing protein [Elizabethkingia anophelis]|uniref:helix-turn-helix domain-containing protein n=1 Tax=Elizabethkingia anophelis TaxID=1117645 RepID=UPI00136FC9EA|nr:helix-turn-helix domain-containing protein [Elizabethkingia anophelis]MYY43958.1 DNA-binding protein [Elizabethkingia anophelis]